MKFRNVTDVVPACISAGWKLEESENLTLRISPVVGSRCARQAKEREMKCRNELTDIPAIRTPKATTARINQKRGGWEWAGEGTRQ